MRLNSRQIFFYEHVGMLICDSTRIIYNRTSKRTFQMRVVRAFQTAPNDSHPNSLTTSTSERLRASYRRLKIARQLEEQSSGNKHTISLPLSYEETRSELWKKASCTHCTSCSLWSRTASFRQRFCLARPASVECRSGLTVVDHKAFQFIDQQCSVGANTY